MKLIKRSNNFYFITDDTPIKLGDWVYDTNEDWQEGSRIIEKANHTLYLDPRCGYEKITHSTKPLESDVYLSYYFYNNIKRLSLSEVKELLGEVDVEKKAAELAYSRRIKYQDSFHDGVCSGLEEGYEIGYNQALEDNKDKKYTEDDLKKAICIAKDSMGVDNDGETCYSHLSTEQIIQSLQPKTEWEVEFVDGKLKLK